MVSMLIRRPLVIVAVVLGVALWASPSVAQTGQVKGKVVDVKNQPVEGAQVRIEMTDGMTRKYEVKTNRRGEFIQIGLQPGLYKITASKDGMSQAFDQKIGLDMSEVNFTLKPGSTARSIRRREKEDRGARTPRSARHLMKASRQGTPAKYDEAIAKFNEVATALPKCTECYANIGEFAFRKKDYEAAEAAYKKVIEIESDVRRGVLGAGDALQPAEEIQGSRRDERVGLEILSRGRRDR